MADSSRKNISRRDLLKLLGATAGASVLANLPSRWRTPVSFAAKSSRHSSPTSPTACFDLRIDFATGEVGAYVDLQPPDSGSGFPGGIGEAGTWAWNCGNLQTTCILLALTYTPPGRGQRRLHHHRPRWIAKLLHGGDGAGVPSSNFPLGGRQRDPRLRGPVGASRRPFLPSATAHSPPTACPRKAVWCPGTLVLAPPEFVCYDKPITAWGEVCMTDKPSPRALRGAMPSSSWARPPALPRWPICHPGGAHLPCSRRRVARARPNVLILDLRLRRDAGVGRRLTLDLLMIVPVPGIFVVLPKPLPIPIPRGHLSRPPERPTAETTRVVQAAARPSRCQMAA